LSVRFFTAIAVEIQKKKVRSLKKLEQNFPKGHYPESKRAFTFRRCNMARLFKGQKAQKSRSVQRVLRAHAFGLRESEIAQTLGWQRRTVNNYLHELQGQGCVYKEGRLWLAEY